MGAYAREDQVKIRLIGKVRFTDNPDEDENRMSNALLRRLIAQAEDELHLDLSPRYDAPFTTAAGQPFERLPDPTKELLRTLAELKSVITVLSTDFGSGSVVDATKYSERLEKRYQAIVDKMLERKKVAGEETNQWKYPPLKDLLLAPHNDQADDGYAGQVLSTSQGDGGFPAKQINDPSENYWNGALDE